MTQSPESLRILTMNKIYSMIGLAMKAGKVVSGEFAVEKAIKDGKAFLVIIAEDASENTKKHFTDMCVYRNISYQIWGEKDTLGHMIGKAERASLAVTDQGFATSIQKYFG